MTVSIKHQFQSAKGDGPDPTKVQPSNWNAEHVLNIATGKMLGRATAGTGAVEEIASTTFGRALLNLADIAALIALGFGNSATKNVGTTAGTVASGDDSRFKSVGITAGTVAAGDDSRFNSRGYLATIVTKTGNYTLALTEKGAIVEGNSASALVFTVPPNTSVAFDIGTIIEFVQIGAGQLSIAAGSGVTIHSSNSKLKLTGQYSGASIYKRGTDEWNLMGDLAA